MSRSSCARWNLTGFRPLAGMSCNACTATARRSTRQSFRPLAGISCNVIIMAELFVAPLFPSPFGDKLHNTKLLYFFLPQKKRTFSGKKAVLRGAKRKARRAQNARSAQNPPGEAESAPAGRVFLVLLWMVYRMRTRMTAGMLLSFSLRRASTAPVASSMV